jgi:hypothetical protein
MDESNQPFGNAGALAILPTATAAEILNRAPQTLRKWAALECGPIHPVKIHGRLGWRVADLKALLSGEQSNQYASELAAHDAEVSK